MIKYERESPYAGDPAYGDLCAGVRPMEVNHISYSIIPFLESPWHFCDFYMVILFTFTLYGFWRISKNDGTVYDIQCGVVTSEAMFQFPPLA